MSRLRVVGLMLCVGCAASHAVDAGATGLESPEVGPCGWDDPPYVVGSCYSETFIRGCSGWAAARFPGGSVVPQELSDPSTGRNYYTPAWVACRGGGYRCVRGDRCDDAGQCFCGTGPACAVGEVCLQYRAGEFSCVCGTGAP